MLRPAMAWKSAAFGPFPPGGLQALTPHVTAYYTEAYPCSNAAIVRGTDATLVFDATLLSQARALRRAVDAAPPPLRELVISHSHNDHAHGAMYFTPPARAWASRFARDRLAYWATRDLAPFAEEMRALNPELAAEYAEVRIVVPEQVVEGQAVIELGGGVRVALYSEALAHTAGDLWARVEPDGVVLCGDLWFNGHEPYLGNGSAAGSLTALRHLRESGGSVFLPGHGPAGQIAADPDEPMGRYCRWVMERTSEGLARGLSGESLRVAVRAEFIAQRDRPGGIRFIAEWPSFLEDAVEATEEEQRSTPH